MSGPWSNVHYSSRTCSERDPLGERDEPIVFENERLAWDFARERGLSYGPRKRIVRRAEGWVWTRGRSIPKAVPLPPVRDEPLPKREEVYQPKPKTGLLFRLKTPSWEALPPRSERLTPDDYPLIPAVEVCYYLEKQATEEQAPDEQAPGQHLSDPLPVSGCFLYSSHAEGAVSEHLAFIEEKSFEQVTRVHVWARPPGAAAFVDPESGLARGRITVEVGGEGVHQIPGGNAVRIHVVEVSLIQGVAAYMADELNLNRDSAAAAEIRALNSEATRIWREDRVGGAINETTLDGGEPVTALEATVAMPHHERDWNEQAMVFFADERFHQAFVEKRMLEALAAARMHASEGGRVLAASRRYRALRNERLAWDVPACVSFAVGSLKPQSHPSRKDGWYLVRTRGSHRQFKHDEKPGLATIPGKPGDDLALGTYHSILKQAGLKR